MNDDFVLVLEDHDDLRGLITVVLDRAGLAVAGVATAEAAHFVMQQAMPRMVLMAHPASGPVRCPLPTLRKHTAPPTVIMSTRPLTDSLLRREFGNYAGCLVKPVESADLLAVVGRIVPGVAASEEHDLGYDRGRRESGTLRKADLDLGDVERLAGKG